MLQHFIRRALYRNEVLLSVAKQTENSIPGFVKGLFNRVENPILNCSSFLSEGIDEMVEADFSRPYDE